MANSRSARAEALERSTLPITHHDRLPRINVQKTTLGMLQVSTYSMCASGYDDEESDVDDARSDRERTDQYRAESSWSDVRIRSAKRIKVGHGGLEGEQGPVAPAGQTSASQLCIHFDVDSFYVSCERIRRPDLCGRPVAITQFNRGGFVAVSYEAKQRGVRKGDGIGERGQKELEWFRDRPDALLPKVMERCPDLVVLGMDMPYYRRISDSIASALEQMFPVVMRNSLDDFYALTNNEKSGGSLASTPATDPPVHHQHDEQMRTLVLSSDGVVGAPVAVSEITDGTYREAAMAAFHARRAVRQTVGVDMTAGVGPCKLMARLVSPLAKPNGQAVVMPNAVDALLRRTPLQRVPGLQAKRGAQLQRLLRDTQLHTPQHHLPIHAAHHGVSHTQVVHTPEEAHTSFSLADVQVVTKDALVRTLGESTGLWVYEAARGRDTSSVFKRPPPNTLITEASFNGARTQAQLEDIARPLCDELLRRLVEDANKHHRAPTTLVIKYRVEYNNLVSRSCRLPQAVVRWIHAQHAAVANHELCRAQSSMQRTDSDDDDDGGGGSGDAGGGGGGGGGRREGVVDQVIKTATELLLSSLASSAVQTQAHTTTMHTRAKTGTTGANPCSAATSSSNTSSMGAHSRMSHSCSESSPKAARERTLDVAPPSLPRVTRLVVGASGFEAMGQAPPSTSAAFPSACSITRYLRPPSMLSATALSFSSSPPPSTPCNAPPLAATQASMSSSEAASPYFGDVVAEPATRRCASVGRNISGGRGLVRGGLMTGGTSMTYTTTTSRSNDSGRKEKARLVDEDTRAMLRDAGYDAEVWCALPTDIRCEILAHIRRSTSASPLSRPSFTPATSSSSPSSVHADTAPPPAHPAARASTKTSASNGGGGGGGSATGRSTGRAKPRPPRSGATSNSTRSSSSRKLDEYFVKK